MEKISEEFLENDLLFLVQLDFTVDGVEDFDDLALLGEGGYWD